MELAEACDPLVLADGTKIDPSTGKVIKDVASKFISVPSPSEAQRLIARTRKTVSELPLPPEKLSAVALVAFYTLYGLDKREISIALEGKLTEDQIENVRELDAYKDFMREARANIINTETQVVREVFEQHAPIAAAKVIELAQSENDVLAFKASQDVLDRAGHRPVDIIEHRHKMDDNLNIVITRRDETKENDIPTIDVTPERISDNA